MQNHLIQPMKSCQASIEQQALNSKTMWMKIKILQRNWKSVINLHSKNMKIFDFMGRIIQVDKLNLRPPWQMIILYPVICQYRKDL